MNHLLISAVNGVVNAVTGRGRDNQDAAPVPVEETQQTQQQNTDPNVSNHVVNYLQDPCSMQRMDFNSCLEMVFAIHNSYYQNKENVTECQFFFDSFKRCQERSQEFASQNMNRYE